MSADGDRLGPVVVALEGCERSEASLDERVRMAGMGSGVVERLCGAGGMGMVDPGGMNS